MNQRILTAFLLPGIVAQRLCRRIPLTLGGRQLEKKDEVMEGKVIRGSTHVYVRKPEAAHLEANSVFGLQAMIELP